jgi:hypothetical protein
VCVCVCVCACVCMQMPVEHSPAPTEASTLFPLVLAESLMLPERLEVGAS